MYKLKLNILTLLAIFSFSMIVVGQGNSQIEGKVVSEDNVPVYNAFVELYNDVNLLLTRTRSSSLGRFTFRGLSSGRYIVKVKPFGTNLKEGSERVEIQQTLGTIPDYAYIDIMLEVDRRYAPTVTIVGTIYAQEIPDEAKRLFISGSKKLKSQDNKGLAEIEGAIKIFPDYFEALSTLGVEYVGKGKYEKGYPFLLRAIDVYNRCPECYYSLGVAFYKLNQLEAGLIASKAAVALSPNSGEPQLLLGILLSLNKDFAESEKALLAAKKLFQDPHPEVHYQLAFVYNLTKRNLEAADELETYLKLKPDLSSKERKFTLDMISRLRNTK